MSLKNKRVNFVVIKLLDSKYVDSRWLVQLKKSLEIKWPTLATVDLKVQL